MTPELLTYENFKAWLQAKKANEHVGFARMCSRCPIATYLIQTTGAPVFVTGLSYDIEHDGNFGPLPEWAISFIRRVDEKHKNVDITAEYALALLSEIKP